MIHPSEMKADDIKLIFEWKDGYRALLMSLLTNGMGKVTGAVSAADLKISSRR